ncbi:hypothetical protein M9Y10_022138 [Tritrichomonas musculus]|uniref:Uncharacterized protein n=1 Tax=Tritrichomonas musculus TaxID=1915356 RepID=A0ABR2KRG3_9EUKA
MNSIWFQTEENTTTDSLNSIFLGVFNKDPVEIGISLNRPITPFQPTDSIQTRLDPPIQSKTELIYSKPDFYTGHLHEFDQFIEPSVHSRRDSNSNYQLNLVPV